VTDLSQHANSTRLTMKLPRQVRAVVFDMDGLMFNTEELFRDAMMAAAADGGHDLPLSFYLSTIGNSGEASRLAFQERYGPEFDLDGLWAAASKLYEITRSQLCLKAGVIELLDFLDSVGLPRAIATSSRHEDVQHNLAAQGLLDRFQAIVARGDYLQGKPDPGPFLKAAERLAIAPESCLALEDSHNGVRSASRAGMMTIMVPDLVPPTSEMEERCVTIIRDLHAVRYLIEQAPLS
jgi:HAD superfamily hydrolase (TIGR01509 family)